MSFVFVLDTNKQPLTPVHPGRARHTRYRKPRFDNRRRPKGWLAPSLQSRVDNILTWVNRLRQLCPMRAISMELVKFDTQLLENPELQGLQYQQGTLAGYECREYLLQKWNRACCYCGKQNVPLQVEHIQARANGGTDRISNLCLACEACNRRKGTQDIAVFLANKPDLLKRILVQAKAPLKDAAAVNTTRWALLERVIAIGLPVECGSGGRTKYNRISRNLPKTHWVDAACVGVSGDIVKAVVPAHLKHAGVHIGRISARAKGGFTISTAKGKVTDIGKKYCQVLQKTDGYGYA